MLKEIVLPAGIDSVTVEEIPKLFATAIYPEVPADAPRRVTKLKKMPLTESAKNHWCGLGTQAFPVSLTNEDLTGMAQGCWKDLRPLSLPIDEPSFQIYLDAFEKHPPSEWMLVPESESPHIHQMVYWQGAVEKWQEQVKQAVSSGKLIPRSKDTLLPMPHATGDSLLECFVTVSDLGTFAAQFDVGIKYSPEFTKAARPLTIDPELLALDASIIVTIREDIAGTTGTEYRRADLYRKEIEARIKRQSEGFFTVEEAAQILADSRPEINVNEMLVQMKRAYDNGQLAIRNSGSQLPILDYEKFREFLNLVKISDIDAWLESCGVAYRFPQVESTESNLQNETNAQDNGPKQRQIFQEEEILRVIRKLG